MLGILVVKKLGGLSGPKRIIIAESVIDSIQYGIVILAYAKEIWKDFN